jgi:hypothetical protein
MNSTIPPTSLLLISAFRETYPHALIITGALGSRPFPRAPVCPRTQSAVFEAKDLTSVRFPIIAAVPLVFR